MIHIPPSPRRALWRGYNWNCACEYFKLFTHNSCGFGFLFARFYFCISNRIRNLYLPLVQYLLSIIIHRFYLHIILKGIIHFAWNVKSQCGLKICDTSIYFSRSLIYTTESSTFINNSRKTDCFVAVGGESKRHDLHILSYIYETSIIYFVVQFVSMVKMDFKQHMMKKNVIQI